MRLKESIDIVEFLQAVEQCDGAVFLQTSKGDITNLKSLLSQYTFMAMMCNPDLLKDAQVICIQEEDYRKLEKYLLAYE